MKKLLILLLVFTCSLNISYAQWQQTNGPFGAGTITCIATSGTNIFAGTSMGGVFLSSDSGTTWTTVNNGLTETIITSLTISGTNIFAGTQDSGVYLSTNTGSSWTAVNNGLLATNVVSLASLGTNILAGILQRGVFLSTDTGATWTPINNGFSNLNVGALVVSGTNIFAVDHGGYFVYLSTDTSSIWSQIDRSYLQGGITSLAVIGQNIFVGTGNGSGILLSTDTGLTCTAVNNGLPLYTNVNSLLVNGTNIFAGTSGGVFLSTNNGGIWSAINNGFTDSTINSLAVSGNNIIFAGTDIAGVWKINLGCTIPAPSITDADNCGNSMLTATGFTGTLLWSTGETTSSITVTIAGTYSVTQTGGGCTSPQVTGTAAPFLWVNQSGNTNAGNDFWFAFPYDSDSTQVTYAISMTSFVNATGTVSIPGIGFNQNFTVIPGSVTRIVLPDIDVIVSNPDVIANNAVHVFSDSTIALFFSEESGGPRNDNSYVLQNGVLGNDYYVMSFAGLGSTYDGLMNAISEFVVIAPGSPVRVEIIPSVATLGGHPAGIPFDTTLLPGQLFQVQSDSDLTGSRVRSFNTAQKFAVIGANAMAAVSCNGTVDPMFEQLIPICSWGEHYVVVSTPQTEDICRVLASQNGTMVNINGNLAATLNAGQYYDTIVKPSSPFFITANNPISVGRILQTNECNNSTIRINDINYTHPGDPDLILVDANEQMLLDSVTFYATTINGMDSNWVQIVTRSPYTNTVFLDGQNIGSSFIPLPFNTSYSYTNLSIDSGAHNLTTTGQGFLAYQVGLGTPTSIGCAAGVYITCAVVIPSFQSSDSTFCTNQCINYTDLSTNATSWQWSFPGAIPSSSTIQNPQGICYDSAGTFNAMLIASHGGERDTLTFTNFIHVFVTPPTPVITQHHDTLYCSTDPSYSSYQWYDSTTLIPGATDTFLIVTHGGNYNVAVTNEFGCKISVGITIAHNVGINEFSADNYISLSPNPASTQLTIHTSSSSINGSATVSIMNVLGEIIQEEKLKWTDDIIINIKNIPPGIYFLQMKTESGSDTKRFVKE